MAPVEKMAPHQTGSGWVNHVWVSDAQHGLSLWRSSTLNPFSINPCRTCGELISSAPMDDRICNTGCYVWCAVEEICAPLLNGR
jgi:hypothetical protein